MQRKHMLLTLAVAALVGFPAASATWYVHGSYEPDTPYDSTQLWANPDVSPSGQKIYFNGVPNIYFTGQNPNVGTAGSRIYPVPVQTYGAYLGVWKDCNKDSYVGMAEGALLEYRSALLTDTSVCPTSGPHNDGTFVTEFLWIGPTDIVAPEFVDDTIINDTAALVWGDWGFPDGGTPAGSCAVNPQPAGTYGSTGGLIYYADCILNNRITSAANNADPDCSLQLCMDPDRPQESNSLLNQRFPVHPWYDPYGDDPSTPQDERTGLLEEHESHDSDPSHKKDPAFATWDCSSPDETKVRDETGELPESADVAPGVTVYVTDEDGTIVAIARPAPALLNPRGSYQDAANDTESGITLPAYRNVNEDSGHHRGCRGDPTFLAGETTNEDNFGGTDTDVGKMDHDHVFAFNGGTSPLLDTCLDRDDETLGDVPPECETLYGPYRDETHRDGGTGLTTFFLYGSGGPSWTSTPNWLATPQLVSRADLTPQGRIGVTFYAHLGASTLVAADLPDETVKFYGSEWCGLNRVDVINGWDCNPDHWWNPLYYKQNSDMETQSTRSQDTCYDAQNDKPNGAVGCRDISVRSGQAYHVRDVDCYDGQLVRGVPVYASLVQISTTGECAPAP